MEEQIEIWDENGLPTGKTALKSEVHQKGWFHPTVHIWFFTSQGRVLLQKRSDLKDTFPGLWDVSVAGHVSAGENPIQAALREVREEIGLSVSPEDLAFIGRFKSEHHHPGNLTDREFHHCYLCELGVPLESLQPAEGEVAALELIPLLRFAEEAWGLAAPGRYVPHDRKYFASVIREIRSRL